jgi:ABC-type oligopeptide transport system substrate-binding subunit/class 3 adenylate cyclase
MNERDQLQQAIAALETQRATLGDAVIDTALAPLREKLAAATVAASTAQQLKYATVLFADITGSTHLSQRLDPEDTMAVMDGALARFQAVIAQYDGRVLRFMGDGLKAIFGAPIAREDDAERAVRAGLALLDETRTYAREIETHWGLTGFTVRVGVHTGPVVLGGGVEGDNTATGMTVNVAARMESTAPPGSLRISHASYRHVRGLFDVRPQPPLTVKGHDDPIQTYLVLRAKPRAFRIPTRGVEGVETRMIGRDAELQQLQDAFSTAVEDRETRVVTVVGEAGVGKSRLLYEFENWLELWSETVWLFKGRARPELTNVPYALIRDLFAFRFEIQDSDSAASVREKLERGIAIFLGQVEVGRTRAHFIGHLLGYDFSASPDLHAALADPRQFHDRALAYLVEFFATATTQQPTAILLEDIHWADDRSLDLIHHLAQERPDLPLLVVGLARPSLFERRRAWGEGRPYHTRVDLRPLAKRHSRQLVDEILKLADNVPSDLRELIVGGAEGSPFYVEELIKMLIDDEVIVTEVEHWHVETARLAGVRVPSTLTGVLQARLDGLPPPERELLQRASVVGRIFWDDAVAQLSAEPPDVRQAPNVAIEDRLGALRARELIYEHEQSAFADCAEYIFKHALLRDVTYETVLKRVRKAYHAQVASWLVAHSGERLGEYLGLIAEHYERAEELDQAVEYLLRAGDRAREVAAYPEAIGAYDRALAILKAQDAHDRAARTLMKLGLTYHQAFDFVHSRQTYDEGFALWQKAAALAPAAVLPLAPHPLRVAWMDPATLDPAMAGEIGTISVIDQLFSGLVDWNSEMDVVPAVARTWDVLDGGHTYIFHLRDDVRWSDGVALTAEDFVYAWRRVLDPATASPATELLLDIKGAGAFARGELPDPERVGVRALDVHTLVVELEEPVGYFLHLLAQYAAYPVPRHAVEAHSQTWSDAERLIVNGPFRLESWRPGQTLVLARNPNFYGRFAGNVEQVELSLNLEAPAKLALYETDRLDVVDLESAELDRARQQHDAEYLSRPWLITEALGFDVTQPPFDDMRLRRAFVLATDRETLAAVLDHHDFPATGGFIPPGMPGHSPGIGLPYDPEQARRLMAEAGYPGGSGFPPITVLIPSSPRLRTIFDYLQRQWHEILGATIAWLEVLERIEGQLIARVLYDTPREHAGAYVFFTGWAADYPDPDSFLRCGLTERWTRWRHESYARLVEQARRSADQRARLDLYQQADRIVIEEALMMPLTYLRAHQLVKPWVKKYPTSSIAAWFWKDVVIEPHE